MRFKGKYYFALFLFFVLVFLVLGVETVNAGSCPSSGWYCGGSVGQNSNYLYYCSGAGANPTLSDFIRLTQTTTAKIDGKDCYIL